MKFYSDFPIRRIRQIFIDLIATAVIVLGAWLGLTIGAAIGALAEVGRLINTAGKGFKGAMTDAANALSGIPLVGDAVRVPFDAASGTGGMLETAGTSTTNFITTVSVIIGSLVTGTVIWAVLLVWVRKRVDFIKNATAVNRISKLEEGQDILALRGLVHGSKKELAAVGKHPVQAWRDADPDVIRKLSALELRYAGVKPSRVVGRITA
ncbi:MAG: hypothetical protein IT191_02755 [Microbacteriaceae bacterium]|nr:hypothetical protein [Microbacteriaceae bacterium]